MPSFDEIFMVSGVAVGIGVDVASGVDVNGIRVGVAADAGVAVDGGGVTALWQAVSKKMEKRNGVIFFMYISRRHCEGALVFRPKQSPAD
jgi:hypothetical protein